MVDEPVLWLTMETVGGMVSVSVWLEGGGRGLVLGSGMPWDHSGVVVGRCQCCGMFSKQGLGIVLRGC